LLIFTSIHISSSCIASPLQEQLQGTAEVEQDFVGAQFGLPEDAVHEDDGNLGDVEVHPLGADDYLHLETVAFRSGDCEQSFKYSSTVTIGLLFIEAITAREIRAFSAQHELCDEISGSAGEFPVEIPSFNSTVCDVPAAHDDVGVLLDLFSMSQ
jgi:hypothetical protein